MLLCQVIYSLRDIVHDDTITENLFMEMTDIFTPWNCITTYPNYDSLQERQMR